MKSLFVGVDPGISGAFAVYDAAEKKLLAVEDMPTMSSGVGDRRQVDLHSLATKIHPYISNVALVIFEDVASMPNDGHVGAFAFGKATGGALGVMAAMQLAIFPVKPSVWKILMGLSHDKDASISRANTLFPQNKDSWKRKKDHGRAEAALLAFFGADRFYKTADIKAGDLKAFQERELFK